MIFSEHESVFHLVGTENGPSGYVRQQSRILVNGVTSELATTHG